MEKQPKTHKMAPYSSSSTIQISGKPQKLIRKYVTRKCFMDYETSPDYPLSFFGEKVTFKNAPVILYIHVVGKYMMNYSCETVNGDFSIITASLVHSRQTELESSC